LARDRYSSNPPRTSSRRHPVHLPFFEAWLNVASLINPSSPTSDVDMGSELVSEQGWTDNTPHHPPRRRNPAGNENISSARFSGWFSPGKFFASMGVV
jgi:hypothetical protein